MKQTIFKPLFKINKIVCFYFIKEDFLKNCIIYKILSINRGSNLCIAACY